MKACRNFVHGTTVAINTVIEGKGAKTALVTTEGTRDVYRIGRGNRPESYNIFFKRPVPLVFRHMTFEAPERMLASGEVWKSLEENERRPSPGRSSRFSRNPLPSASSIPISIRLMKPGWGRR